MASGDFLWPLLPQANEPPTANNAACEVRNGILVLAFDGTTSESAVFRGMLPPNYGGGGLTVLIYWISATATTGDVVWGASIERGQDGGTDMDADSFATEQLSAAVTTNATSGIVNKSTITISSGANMDSLVAGEPFRIKIARKPADTGDTMNGTDAHFLEAVIKET